MCIRDSVYSVEIDPGLAEIARNNLQQAGVANVSVEIGDGVQGRSSDAPYDVIVLSGSLPVLPERLLNPVSYTHLDVYKRQLLTCSISDVRCLTLFSRLRLRSFNSSFCA